MTRIISDILWYLLTDSYLQSLWVANEAFVYIWDKNNIDLEYSIVWPIGLKVP